MKLGGVGCIQGVPKVVHQPEHTFIVTDAQTEHYFQKYHTVLYAKAVLNIQ